MKQRVWILLAVLSLVNIAVAGQIPHRTANAVPEKPHIPYFIQETYHPWLHENKEWLEQIDSPERALCHSDYDLQLSTRDTPTRPVDLFKRLAIINRVYWSTTEVETVKDRLTEMLRCPAALQQVEEFQVRIQLSDSEWGREFETELLELFVGAVKAMSNLKYLDWNPAVSNEEAFGTQFIASNITFPTVRRLRVAESMDWIVSLCPNLEELESGGDWFLESDGVDPMLNLIKSARNAKNLTAFGMVGIWKLKDIQELVQAMPNITSLKIYGSLGGYGDCHEPKPEILESFSAVLSQLPKLQHLSLPSPTNSCLRNRMESWCGNIFDGEDGRAFGRELAQEDALITDMASDIVLRNKTSLRSLKIGDYRANITLSDDGQLVAIWPWTNRLTEWVYEQWPEPQPGPWGNYY